MSECKSVLSVSNHECDCVNVSLSLSESHGVCVSCVFVSVCISICISV